MKQTAVEWLIEKMLDSGIGICKEWRQQAKEMEHNQRGYTKEDILKAGEIGEINHHDYKHIVKLLDEARTINETYGSKGSDEVKSIGSKDINGNEFVFPTYSQTKIVYTHEDVLKMLRSFHNLEMNVQLCMLKLTPIDMEEKLFEYWNGGIKSTEEGGKSFYQYHNEHHEDNLDEMPTSSQTEISDEEIEKIVDDNFGNIHSTFDEGIIYGMKLYREQLKQKQ